MVIIAAGIGFETINAARVMENLGRGVVAARTGSDSVYIGWRMLGTDPSDIGFNIYRDGVKINAEPVTQSTNYIHNTSSDGSYTVRPVIGGVEQGDSGAAQVWQQQYKSIQLNRPAGGTTPDGVSYTYNPGAASVRGVIIRSQSYFCGRAAWQQC